MWMISGAVASTLLAVLVRRYEPEMQRWQLLIQVGVTSTMLAALAFKYGPPINMVVSSEFLIGAAPAAAVDLRTRRLPNWLVLISYVLTATGLIGALITRPRIEVLLSVLTGAALFFLFYAALYFSMKGQLGGGDVKFSVPAGAILGWHSWSAPLEGLVLIWIFNAITYLIARAYQRKNSLPHGPFIVAGTVAALLS
jgi:leader peptidase (prepilin peptidase)/N-methyltransferase